MRRSNALTSCGDIREGDASFMPRIVISLNTCNPLECLLIADHIALSRSMKQLIVCALFCHRRGSVSAGLSEA
jgi:hypothetical protein